MSLGNISKNAMGGWVDIKMYGFTNEMPTYYFTMNNIIGPSSNGVVILYRISRGSRARIRQQTVCTKTKCCYYYCYYYVGQKIEGRAAGGMGAGSVGVGAYSISRP